MDNKDCLLARLYRASVYGYIALGGAIHIICCYLVTGMKKDLETGTAAGLDVDCQSSDFQNSAQCDRQIGNQCLSERSCLLQHESGRTYHHGCVADCDHAQM